GAGAVGGAGADADRVGAGGGVLDRIAALVLVADGGEEDRPLLVGVLDRVLEHLRPLGRAQAHVDDPGAVVGGPAHGAGGVGRLGALLVPDLDRHEPAVPGEPGDALAVVAPGADQPGDRRAVADG